MVTVWSRIVIDWVTAILPCQNSGEVVGGFLASITSHGEIEWQVEKKVSVAGSHEANICVKSIGTANVMLDGNPAKWLQGHNLFGSDDLRELVFATMVRLTTLLRLSPSPDDLNSWRRGKYDLKRVDCTAMWELPRRPDVRAWLRAAEFQSKSRHGRPVTRGSTLYFGQHSRRWSVKFYSKGDELDAVSKGHSLPHDIAQHDKLHKWADNKLRGELTLRAMALKELHLDRASGWNSSTPLEQLLTKIEGLSMAEQFSLTAESIEGLAGRLVAVYKLWKEGEDLRGMYSRATFYRYRAELLKHGIDIAIRQPPKATNVIPLIRVLRPEAIAQVPDWAIDTPLYFKEEC